MRLSNLGGTGDHCYNYCDSIQYTVDYGEICIDCSLEITRPYIKHAMRETEARIEGVEVEGGSL